MQLTVSKAEYTLMYQLHRPNRYTTFLTLSFLEDMNEYKYLVGYSDNWRPDSSMSFLEKVPYQESRNSSNSQFMQLVRGLKQHARFDWEIYTRESKFKKILLPTYPVNELLGKEFVGVVAKYKGIEYVIPVDEEALADAQRN